MLLSRVLATIVAFVVICFLCPDGFTWPCLAQVVSELHRNAIGKPLWLGAE